VEIPEKHGKNGGFHVSLGVLGGEKQESMRRKFSEPVMSSPLFCRTQTTSLLEVPSQMIHSVDPHWLLALQNYEPWNHQEPWWQDQAATGPQIALLRRFGWEPPDDATRGECAHVISRMGAIPTPKQRRVLERRGLWHDDMDRFEATEAITMLAEQEGWI
jgi:hypothetical protein